MSNDISCFFVDFVMLPHSLVLHGLSPAQTGSVDTMHKLTFPTSRAVLANATWSVDELNVECWRMQRVKLANFSR